MTRKQMCYAMLFPLAVLILWVRRRVWLPTWIHNRALTLHVLGNAAWNPKEAGADYCWRFLDIPLTEIPSMVNIGAVMHSVQVSDGLVVFSNKSGFYGHHARISFERDSDGMLWYLRFSETWDRVPMSHVTKAFAYVQAVYGGDFAVRSVPQRRVNATEAAT
jgi:hypothetical protein